MDINKTVVMLPVRKECQNWFAFTTSLRLLKLRTNEWLWETICARD